MLAIKLAYRNLVGAGLRTWLNVIVLSFSFVVIIWHKGLLDGWHRQARRDMIDWEIGGGHYWHEAYDPYDPFTIDESHGTLPPSLRAELDGGEITPILVAQATIYPEGRIQNVLLKGIDPRQKILALPSLKMDTDIEEIPVLIGTRMAASSKLDVGAPVMVQWRDAGGTFDAWEAKVVGIFRTDVPTVDSGQLWLPLERLRGMMQLPGEATVIVTAKDAGIRAPAPGWIFESQARLLADIDKMIRQKSIGGSILYILLLLLAMLAIFDTQVLSIFRRQREIGMEIALGMTRGQVIRLFTVEGAMHGVLAALVGAVYGIPLLAIQAKKGFGMPQGIDDYGMTIAERIIPVYSAGLVIGTVVLVMITTTVVSFIPARKIGRMKPTDAIKGKLQ